MKKIFMFFVALAMTVMATAQNYEYTGVFGMPYFNINAGAIAPLTSPTTGILPAAGIELGTYVTPVWGTSAEGVAVFNLPPYGQQTILNSHYVLGNGKMNVSNFLAGYDGYPRRVEFVLVAGAGWGRSYTKMVPNADGETPEKAYTTADQMVYNTGAEINFNLGQARACQISLRPSVIWGHNAENQFGFNPSNAQLRVNLGFTYKFGNRRVKSHNFVTNDYAVSQHDYDVLMARYEECHSREPEKVEVPVEVPVEKLVPTPVNVPVYFGENLILFPCGSAKLDAKNKEILRHFVEDVQDDVIVYIVGSADSKTGTESFNYDLAGKRAKAVRDELVKLGINENDIAIDTTLDGASTVKASRSASVTIMARPE